MKVRLSASIKSFSGKLDGIIFCLYKEKGIIIARKESNSAILTSHQKIMGRRMSSISKLFNSLSLQYKEDLLLYSKLLFQKPEYSNKVSGNGYSVFVKLMWELHNSPDSGISLDSLPCMGDDSTPFLPFLSVAIAINNGYLPVVPDYSIYNNSLIPG